MYSLAEDTNDEFGIHALAQLSVESAPPKPFATPAATTPLDPGAHHTVEPLECKDGQKTTPYLFPKRTALSRCCLLSPDSPRIIPATERAMNSTALPLGDLSRHRTSSESSLSRRRIPSLPANTQGYISFCVKTPGAIPVYLWPEIWQGILQFLDTKGEQYDNVLSYFRRSTAVITEVWIPRKGGAVGLLAPFSKQRPCRSRQQCADLLTLKSTPEMTSSTQSQRHQDSKKRVQEDRENATALGDNLSYTVVLKNKTSSSSYVGRVAQIQVDQDQFICLQKNKQEIMETDTTNTSAVAFVTPTAFTSIVLSNSKVQNEPVVSGSAQTNELTDMVMGNSSAQEATRCRQEELGVDQTAHAGTTGLPQMSRYPLVADPSCSVDISTTSSEAQQFQISRAFDHEWERLYELFVGAYPSKGRARTLEPGQMIKIPGLGVLWNSGVCQTAHGIRLKTRVSSVPFRSDGGNSWLPMLRLNLRDRSSWETRLAFPSAEQRQHGKHLRNMRNNLRGQGIQPLPTALYHTRSSSSIRAWHLESPSCQPEHAWSAAVPQRPVRMPSHDPALPMMSALARPVGLNAVVEQYHARRRGNGYQLPRVLSSTSTRLGRSSTMPTSMSRPSSATASGDYVTWPTFCQGTNETEASYKSANAFQSDLTILGPTNVATGSINSDNIISPRRTTSPETMFSAIGGSYETVRRANNLTATTRQSDAENLVPSPLTHFKEFKKQQDSIIGGDNVTVESKVSISPSVLPLPNHESSAPVEGESKMLNGATMELNKALVVPLEATVTYLGTPTTDRRAPIASIGPTNILKETPVSFSGILGIEGVIAVKDSADPTSMADRKIMQVNDETTYIVPHVTYANVVVTGNGLHVTDTITPTADSKPCMGGNELELGRSRLRGRRKWRALTESDY